MIPHDGGNTVRRLYLLGCLCSTCCYAASYAQQLMSAKGHLRQPSAFDAELRCDVCATIVAFLANLACTPGTAAACFASCSLTEALRANASQLNSGRGLLLKCSRMLHAITAMHDSIA
jgi:hypothetical protein